LPTVKAPAGCWGNRISRSNVSQSGSGETDHLFYDPGSGPIFVNDNNNREMIFEGSNMPSWLADIP
jgi:hypothetical protein